MVGDEVSGLVTWGLVELWPRFLESIEAPDTTTTLFLICFLIVANTVSEEPILPILRSTLPFGLRHLINIILIRLSTVGLNLLNLVAIVEAEVGKPFLSRLFYGQDLTIFLERKLRIRES